MLSKVLGFVSLAAAAAAAPLQSRAARTSPPEGCLTVGSSGTYKTVQSAVDAQEQVTIPALRSALVVYGETEDTSRFSANKVTITQSRSQDDSADNDATATLRAHTANLRVYNVNLVNTRGKGSQALALSAQADRQGYYACQFRGYQDTVLANEGAQVYARSYVEGATDFIFGQRARAWFDAADIRVLAASKGYITANGRDSADNPSYYVIHNSAVSARSGDSVPAGAYYLGRPWRNYARVVFQKTSLSGVVNAAGWSVWNTGDERTDEVEFGEYGNTGAGAGASGSRAAFAKQLS